jgi:glycosyltransferase involved in cell wall biosynthesis
MKVLIVTPQHYGGGAESAVMNAIRLLLANGHNVAHFSLTYDPKKLDCPVKHYFAYPNLYECWGTKRKGIPLKLTKLFYWLEQKNGLRQLMVHRFRKAIADFQPDVIHLHPIADFLWSAPLLKVPHQMGIPTVLTFHSIWFVCPNQTLLQAHHDPNAMKQCDGLCVTEENPGKASRTHHCFSNFLESSTRLHYFRNNLTLIPTVADIYLAPSEAVRQLILRSKRIPATQIAVHHNEIDLSLLNQPIPWQTLPPKTYFLGVGRLEQLKGFMDVVKLFQHLPEIPLKIVGDGSEREKIETYIQKHQLKNIEVLGWQSGQALQALYQNSYALIFPSLLFEAAGMVSLESYAYGKPVIASDIGGIPEFVEHNVAGLLYSPGDMNHLREHVESLWHDPQFTQYLGHGGYNFLNQRFNPDKLHEALQGRYQQAIQNYNAVERGAR